MNNAIPEVFWVLELATLFAACITLAVSEP